MNETTDRLDAIQSRLDAAAPGLITITPSDVAWLRDIARKQQAAIDAALNACYMLDDGTEYEHVRDCEGEPTCPACWAVDIRKALGAIR